MGRKWSQKQRVAHGERMRSLWRDKNFSSKLRKVDHEQIIKDYECGGPDGKGLTMREVAKKNRCKERTVQRILKTAGKSRGWAGGRFFKTEGWRKLPVRPSGNPRSAEGAVLTAKETSISGALLTQAGVDPHKVIWAKWEVLGKNRLQLLVRN